MQPFEPSILNGLIDGFDTVQKGEYIRIANEVARREGLVGGSLPETLRYALLLVTSADDNFSVAAANALASLGFRPSQQERLDLSQLLARTESRSLKAALARVGVQ